jgi:hypothetical protein
MRLTSVLWLMMILAPQTTVSQRNGPLLKSVFLAKPSASSLFHFAALVLLSANQAERTVHARKASAAPSTIS